MPSEDASAAAAQAMARQFGEFAFGLAYVLVLVKGNFPVLCILDLMHLTHLSKQIHAIAFTSQVWRSAS